MEEFSKLVDLMAALRGKNGCAWDKKQTIKGFKTFILEEVHEVMDAIERDDYKDLREELGDLLFHIVFISRICEEDGHFDIRAVIEDVHRKMYNRHPHVFGNGEAGFNIEQKWEEIKKEEKEDYSLLSHIPKTMPALLRAYIVSKRVARVGFDWENIHGIYEKIDEELDELKRAEEAGDPLSIKEEVGDLLFTIVNISRHHGIDPEDALRQTTDKFTRRFNYVEKNTDVATATPSDMNRLWDEIKSMEKGGI